MRSDSRRVIITGPQQSAQLGLQVNDGIEAVRASMALSLEVLFIECSVVRPDGFAFEDG